MADAEKNFEVVKKYYFRKKGVLETQGYDWIGKAYFELYPVELDGKLGFANSNGDIAIPIIYDLEMHVNDTVWAGNREYLALRKNKLYGLIKHDGSLVIDFCWNNMKINKLSEDLIPIAIDKKWGFANVKTGEIQIEPAYDDVDSFKDGFAGVYIKGKCGMIDVNGNMIVKPNYQIYPYFVGDFAILFEGSTKENCPDSTFISTPTNCKIINKKGYEIVSDCSWIDRISINIFILTRKEDGKTVRTIKQLIAFPDYIVVIDDGEYLKGYFTASKKIEYADKLTEWDTNYYTDVKYIGGGSWSVIDYSGKPIKIPDYKLQELKESLLA